MAPEILVPSCRLKAATFEDLKKVDVWAFGMVMFNVLNPDLKYPYQLDIEKNKSSTDQVQEFVTQKKLPTPSLKYGDLQNSVWHPILKTSEECLQFDPCVRPSAMMLKERFQTLLHHMNIVMDQGNQENENRHEEKKIQTTAGTR